MLDNVAGNICQALPPLKLLNESPAPPREPPHQPPGAPHQLPRECRPAPLRERQNKPPQAGAYTRSHWSST